MGGLGSSGEQQYSLRWNDFHSSILSSFRHLRDEEDFVDVTLACDGCSFTAHKVVLSACSPYFRTLLKANPCQHPIVILRDVREQDMEALLRFMYNGEVHIGQEQLTDFLKTAQTLQVRGLADVPTKEQQKLFAGGNSSAAVAWMNNNNNINSNNSNETTIGGSPAGSLTLTGIPPGGAGGGGGGSGGVGGSSAGIAGSGSGGSAAGTGSSAAIVVPLPAGSANVLDTSGSGTGAGGIGSPPMKRSRSSDLGSTNLPNRFSPSPASSGNTNNHQSSGPVQLEIRESLLSQALESSHNSISSNNHQLKGNSDSSVHAQSTGEESNSSDTGLSERGLPISGNGPHSISDLSHAKSEPSDYLGPPDHHTNSALVLDPSRQPNFPAALLGLQGLPGLLPGPSGIHGGGPDNSFVSRRGLDMMRVRATDPRPCPKCGKIYRSAHTLRTHLEDKHTICPGYRCVLCGTVAKSRNSLHSHMSRQHRGISTKDLPVLPMPSPFDPELASRLLAKAGVKVSAAELRARSSPTGPPRRPDIRLDLKSSSDDPEDLTVHNNHTTPAARFCTVDIRPVTPPSITSGGTRHPTSPPHSGGTPTGHHLINNKEQSRGPSTGSAILDTYLQFIAENSANLHLSAEQAAKVAARVSEEQRRLAAMEDRVTNVDESSGAEEEDEFSEEEREPEPIKAE